MSLGCLKLQEIDQEANKAQSRTGVPALFIIRVLHIGDQVADAQGADDDGHGDGLHTQKARSTRIMDSGPNWLSY